jgi:hypothetical protein
LLPIPSSRIEASVRAVGSIVLDVSTDRPTVLPAGGPHQQFSGDVGALCAYFAAA